MATSRRVRLRDMRGIYNLVGECCDVGGNLHAWLERMCEGLGGLLSSMSVNGAMVTPECLRAGKLPGPGDEGQFDWGWYDDGQKNVFLEYWDQEMGRTDPTFLSMMRLPQFIATRRRRELVSDRQWYGGEHFNEFYRRADSDDCMVSRTAPPLDSGLAMFYVRLTRALDDPPYTMREQRVLRLFVASLAPLIGKRLATLLVMDPDLPPRLRQVLELLMKGQSEKQVAAELDISRHTVHDHVKRLHKHFDVASRGELLARAFARRDPSGQLSDGAINS